MANKFVTMVIPWPPSSNRYWRYWNRRVIISKDAREYKKTIKSMSYEWEPRHLTGRLDLSIIAFPPDKRARDLDNLLKITIDSLESTGLFNNDSQIDRIVIERGEVVKDGSLGICLRECHL